MLVCGKSGNWRFWGKNGGFGGKMGVLGDPNNPAQVNIPPKTAQATIPPENPGEPTELATCCGTNGFAGTEHPTSASTGNPTTAATGCSLDRSRRVLPLRSALQRSSLPATSFGTPTTLSTLCTVRWWFGGRKVGEKARKFVGYRWAKKN